MKPELMYSSRLLMTAATEEGALGVAAQPTFPVSFSWDKTNKLQTQLTLPGMAQQ